MARAASARLIAIVASAGLGLCLEMAGAAAQCERGTRVFPTCEIDAPRADERVSVIYANGGKGLSSATLGSDAIVTEVVDVEIEPAEKPHYVALSSGKPVIWRFTGRVDTLSRIMVLGSQYEGAIRSGVVGVPKERVIFAKTDLAPLTTIALQVCMSLYRACELSAYFDIPKAARMHLAGPVPQTRFPVAQFVEQLHAGIVRIPRDGTVEAKGPDRSGPVRQTRSGSTGPVGRYEPFKGVNDKEKQGYERGVVAISPKTVVSPDEVRPYKTLPGLYGLRELVKAGALVPADAPAFKAAYDAWNEAASKPFRSHLDPDFLFSYEVDYLITRPVQLPAKLPATTAFLVAGGVETPDWEGAERACLFFADGRDLVIDSKEQRDPRCDAIGPSLAPSRWLKRGYPHAVSRSSLELMKAQSAAARQACKRTLVDADAHLAGIALHERAFPPPGEKKTPPRRVDVQVKRPGKVALFLDALGRPIDWHIAQSPKTEITTVLLLRRGDHTVHGIESSVPVREVRASAVGKAPCQHFNALPYGFLGGPAALALDESLKVLAGHGLDRLVRATADARWPPASPDPDAPRVGFVID